MRYYITGVSCVGKTTIGRLLAELIDCPFFDLDEEIEKYFGLPIERMQEQFLTIHSFREEAKKALSYILSLPQSGKCVIALPPSGLMGAYWNVIKNFEGKIIVLVDDPQNILKRIRFYDKDSRPIEIHLSEQDKKYYLSDIKKDIKYFGRTYRKADIMFDINGSEPETAAKRLKELLQTE
jgi:shikimate kinase